MCRRVAQHELLLGCMMAQCGVDAGRAHQLERGQAYAAAVDRCLLCRAATECALWLADKGNTEAPTFCPNLGYFRRCTTARPPS
jgi:hypothetical protein